MLLLREIGLNASGEGAAFTHCCGRYKTARHLTRLKKVIVDSGVNGIDLAVSGN